jgi:formylmethanofuran dehydrogenase subunit E
MKRHLTFASFLLMLVFTFWSLANTSHQHPEGHGDHSRVVLKCIPRDHHDFRSDVVPLIDEIIARHGEQEWESVVLTNEFHRHLGIYSILGAKMGLHARDYFGVGLDELNVESFAGLKPPVSCLNDGLQVSTGATLGHGTISIVSDGSVRPQARFIHDGKAVVLTLKASYWNQVKQDIRKTIQQHGLHTPEYWQAVRKLGLNYWLQWRRSELFERTR